MTTHYCRTVVLSWDDFVLQRQCLETFVIVMTRCYWHLSGGSLCRMFSSILQCTARHPQQRIIWSNNAEVEKPCCTNVTGKRVSIRWKRPLFCKILPEYNNINNPLKCSSFLKKLQCMYWLISLFLSNWSVFWLLGGHQSGTSCVLLSVRGSLENAPWVLTYSFSLSCSDRDPRDLVR